MDRQLLVLSTFCFLFGFAYTMYALGARVYRRSRLNLIAISLGFLCQTGFLYLRGEALGRCPLTNHFEVLAFLSWSMVLFYLLIGPAYRLSLLGFFTSPLDHARIESGEATVMPTWSKPRVRSSPISSRIVRSLISLYFLILAPSIPCQRPD